jgi:type VI secretion system secreted protein Hcp
MIKCSFKFRQDRNGEYVKVHNEAVTGRYSEVCGGQFMVEVPIDEKTGAPVSSRRYTPLEIIKFIDSTSPIIFNAVTKGIRYAEAVLTMYWYSTDKGEEEPYYEILLEDVTFIKQKEIFSEGGFDSVGKETPPMESVCLVAGKVKKTFFDGHISCADEYKSKAMAAAAA